MSTVPEAPVARVLTELRNWRKGWPTASALHVVLAGGLAAAGALHKALLVLLAVALSLPFGIPGFIGLYVACGVITQVANAFGVQTTRLTTWFVVVGRIAVSLIFAAPQLRHRPIEADVGSLN